MKRSTKALLLIFVFVVAGLSVYLYVIPKVEGMSEKTTVLEYGDIPIMDETEVFIVRDETLFGAKKSGVIEYKEEEGAKVRKGVKIFSLSDGAGVPASGDVEAVKQLAGDELVLTQTYKANKTAVVSYYGDGFEGKFTPENIDSITKSEVKNYPARGVSLVRTSTVAGDPIYKLTNNNEWYMIYWITHSEDTERYKIGSHVDVTLGETEISAEIISVTREGSMDKVILRSDLYYEDLPVVRKAEAKIVFDEFSGLIAPLSAIIEHEGKPGVYVKQRSGGYKWVSVNILKTASSRCTLSVNVYYDDAGEAVKTVGYYDVVLTDPKESGY